MEAELALPPPSSGVERKQEERKREEGNKEKGKHKGVILIIVDDGHCWIWI